MAAEIENVVIQAGGCSLILLPSLGGKIASLRVGDEELLQAPLLPYAPRNLTMAFEDSDASGWDECLPSVAGCIADTPAGPVTIPDHGDLWRLPWDVLDYSPDSVTMRARCVSLPLELTRTILLSESTTGLRLQLLYSLANLGADKIPWSWAAHPLFAVDPGDRIVLPSLFDSVTVEGSAGGTLGSQGDTIGWPRFRRTHGAIADLNVAQSPASGIGDKIFVGPYTEGADFDGVVPTKLAWAALERLRLGLRLTVRFEPRLTPYLGLWLCYGGWPESSGAKQVCVALEPSTAPADSLATLGAWSRWIAPGETYTWPMELSIDSISARTEVLPA